MLGLLQIIFLFEVLQCTQAYHPTGHYGTDWTIFPDEEGKLHYINLRINNESLYALSEQADFFKSSTRFWLYTRENKGHYEELYIDQKPRNKTYFKDKPVVMLVHGWTNSGYSKPVQFIKDEYLKHFDLNIIIVDWHLASRTPYLLASFLTPLVGEEIKDMVLTLIKKYAFDINDLHIIGHSLGAHVAGRAGAALSRYSAIVPRVTGLDPARPFFEFPSLFDAITKNDAHFVDIMHTNLGLLGIIKDVGHADFYPNGGFYQSHCKESPVKFISDHLCAPVYYGESISLLFTSHRCPSYEDYKRQNCDRIDYMGMPCSTEALGKYYTDIL